VGSGLRRRTTRAALLVLAVAATIGFAYLALRGVRLADLWRALRTSNYWWTLPSLGVLAVCVLLRAARWGFLFRRGRRPPLESLTAALLVSYFFNAILPARAGEIARIVDLKRRTGKSRAETSATVVLERVYDVVALLVLLFVFQPWMPRITWLRTAAILGAVVALGVVSAAVVLAVFGERPLLVALRPLGRVGVSDERIRALAESVGHGLAAVRDLRLAGAVLAWTTVSWLAAATAGWLLMPGFDLHVSLVAALLVTIAVNLAQVLPSLPSALGVFEAATVVALKAYGIPRAEALSYALVLHAVNFFPYLVAGPLVLGPRRLVRTGRLDLAS
jgi:uncharacterized protein (TIRG00374 family)